MIKLLRLPLALLCCALSACVTQTIREGTDLSTSGIAYTQAVNALLDPVLRPIRRIMPATGALDLSPMVLIIGLTIVQIVVKNLAYASVMP